MMRFLVAGAIALALYGIAAGIGSALYAADVIGTGATHNDCPDYRNLIAEERGIDEEDVQQSEIKRRAQECLAAHALTEEEAFREEYLFWAAWPAGICAVIFLLWPAWARALHRQEEATGGHVVDDGRM